MRAGCIIDEKWHRWEHVYIIVSSGINTVAIIKDRIIICIMMHGLKLLVTTSSCSHDDRVQPKSV